jgi:hypothetical protein
MRVLAGVIVVAMGVAAGVVARAQEQTGQQPPPPKNLQVLPKDIPRQQLLATMRTFTAALGVECTHCHVSSQDRASDAKPPKLVARKMIEMTMHINGEHLKGVGEPPAAGQSKVTCFTCHRGALKPLTAPASSGGGH